MVINGQAHGPKKGITTCQLYMRSFKDKDTIWVEPFRAKSFPVVKDLVVDRSTFDKIMAKRRIHFCQARKCPRSQQPCGGKEKSRLGFSCSSLHWLWGLRISLAKTPLPLFLWEQRFLTWLAFPKASPKEEKEPKPWFKKWKNTLAPVATPMPALLLVQKALILKSLLICTESFFAVSLRARDFPVSISLFLANTSVICSSNNNFIQHLTPAGDPALNKIENKTEPLLSSNRRSLQAFCSSSNPLTFKVADSRKYQSLVSKNQILKVQIRNC